MPHPFPHFAWTLGAIGVAAALAAVTRNRAIRRRLLFALVALGAAAVLHVAILREPANDFLQTEGWRIEGLLITFGIISAIVALALNPWFRDVRREHSPAIVQDTVVAALVLASSAFIFRSSSFFVGITGSAIVVGLALQETLGNAFAGLAIQIERPFRVGHWISVLTYEGVVIEMTWRATKIRTKFGNLVSLPNSAIVKEAITNYSEPTAPTRLFVEVGASYSAPPTEVSAAMLAAIRQVPLVLETPPPDILVREFAASSITYRGRFWINDFEWDEQARDRVRRAVYYEFRRRQIEIPFPIQVELRRNEFVEPPAARTERYLGMLAHVPVLEPLPVEGRRALAEAAAERLFAGDEAIVREGEPGGSMFVICRGRAAVAIAGGREIAKIPEGGYFGEMSLLTGEPRTATVRADGDCLVLEIGAEAFRAYVTKHPDVIDTLAHAAEARRKELDQGRAAAAAHTGAPVSLAQRMRRFLGLG